MKNERVLGTIRSKRGQFDPNSTRFNIKHMRIRDQIRAKIRSNRGLTKIQSVIEMARSMLNAVNC